MHAYLQQNLSPRPRERKYLAIPAQWQTLGVIGQVAGRIIILFERHGGHFGNLVVLHKLARAAGHAQLNMLAGVAPAVLAASGPW